VRFSHYRSISSDILQDPGPVSRLRMVVVMASLVVMASHSIISFTNIFTKPCSTIRCWQIHSLATHSHTGSSYPIAYNHPVRGTGGESPSDFLELRLHHLSDHW
jgi:hypothetical protein